MSSKFSDIVKIPELRRRILFTLGTLALYRIGIYITVPGVNRSAMAQMSSGEGGGLLGLMNLFTGGALEMMSIFALGIMPYISASIILQLMTIVVPAIERLKKEGQTGQKKITQWTRYGTIGLGLVQGFMISAYLENLNSTNPELGLIASPGIGFKLMTVLTLTAGTVFVMWLGEQITERGLGNGISLIITAGIIAQFPNAVIQTYAQYQTGAMDTFQILVLAVIALFVTGAIVYMETAQRRIPLQYSKRILGAGANSYGGQAHHLPLKVNMAGVIPPIFAMSLLIFPTTIAGYFADHPAGQWVQQVLIPGDWRYNLLYVMLIVFFCFFYTAVQVNPVDIADNLKRSQAFIPGIRPGKKTADYIDEVLKRLTIVGALYISAVCVLPYFLIDELGVSFYFGGTSLLIIVVVGLDTVTQIENHLISRHYEGFGAGGSSNAPGRIKGRDTTGFDTGYDI